MLICPWLASCLSVTSALLHAVQASSAFVLLAASLFADESEAEDADDLSDGAREVEFAAAGPRGAGVGAVGRGTARHPALERAERA